ncbi:MAG TPA: carboxypeptidase-like regulatory domain-containing protein [Longimicrobiaceae bacterium]|nr:carboxypeptidase-like regulatory domain-containing protein [Longimicrobiaceae bacterium]
MRACLLLLAALLLALPGSPAAQQPPGAVEGAAVAAEGGAPVPLSLVQLLSAEGSDEPLRGTLTDAGGGFRFEAVPPGRYRLRLDRIGFVSAPSEVFVVEAGRTVRRTLAAALRPVELEGISVAGNACYGLDRLEEAPDLAALWRETQKALETRRRFMQQYRFVYDRRVDGDVRLRLLRDRRIAEDTTIVSHPDSALARQARRRGFGEQGRTSFVVRIPDELELLDDDFLRTHCLEGDPGDDAAGLALRFRPTGEPRREGFDLRGVIRIDPETFVVRELEFEYLSGRRPVARGTVRYAEVRTPDGLIRLPAGGRVTADPRGVVGTVVQDFSGTFSMSGYRDFERVRDAAAPQS